MTEHAKCEPFIKHELSEIILAYNLYYVSLRKVMYKESYTSA